MKIRNETPADADQIRRITEDAFAGSAHSSGTESAIIDALRREGSLTLSLLAEEGDEIVGHVAFSPVLVGGREVAWFGLGPVSVRPDRQHEGIGGTLICEGLSRLHAQGARGCVVLGDPGYYHRFGFMTDAKLRFPGVPAEYFMCLAFSDPIPTGVVSYHSAFGAS